jgi:hypothetical protein
MDDILKRFSVDKDLFEKKIRGCKETTENESVRKLFYPKGKKGENIRQVPIIARMTFTGYKVTQKHGEETRSNLIGPNIYKILSISCCVSSSNNFI